MALDPALRVPTPIPDGVDALAARLQSRLRYLEDRVAALEHQTSMTSAAVVTSATSPPTGGVEGSMIATTTPRLWVKVAGTWRFVALT